ncbi:uncharacterized protein PFL1_00133 [Pseudozyma flocculosa PF-1]|uniref:Uncharacterized protein n=1 Tax=Pseudozyma flocculosa TaxID=84751 RepID=A0A5C3ES61_9BASI|nr:uncharacterized protein PFL1_00133 [Pseudozyma flocculosa PF-1]EPQ31934.1 hypothetical protein PFL1_00133 [Pseudozyma flocculosa PF-1]SPO35153.1 uncharacterized protein PSFLO_00624 [Pseudozyma flocculosa]
MSFQSWPSIQGTSQASMTQAASSQPGLSGASRLSALTGRPAHSMFSRSNHRLPAVSAHLHRQAQSQAPATPMSASSDTVVAFDEGLRPPPPPPPSQQQQQQQQQCSRPSSSTRAGRPSTAPNSAQVDQEHQELLLSLQDTVHNLYAEVRNLGKERRQDAGRVDNLLAEHHQQLRDDLGGQLDVLKESACSHSDRLADQIKPQMEAVLCSLKGVQGHVSAMQQWQEAQENRQREWHEELRREQLRWQNLQSARQQELQKRLEESQQSIVRQQLEAQRAFDEQRKAAGEQIQTQARVEKGLVHIAELLGRVSQERDAILTTVPPSTAPGPSGAVPAPQHACRGITAEQFGQMLEQHLFKVPDGPLGALLGKRVAEMVERQLARTLSKRQRGIDLERDSDLEAGPEQGMKRVFAPSSSVQKHRSPAKDPAARLVVVDVQKQRLVDPDAAGPLSSKPDKQRKASRRADEPMPQQLVESGRAYNLRDRPRRQEEARPSTAAGILLSTESWTGTGQTSTVRAPAAASVGAGASKTSTKRTRVPHVAPDRPAGLYRAGQQNKRKLTDGFDHEPRRGKEEDDDRSDDEGEAEDGA